jgi:hypothetical protein
MFKYICYKKSVLQGYEMAVAVGHRPLPSEAGVRSLPFLIWFVADVVALGQVSIRVRRVSSVSIIS